MVEANNEIKIEVILSILKSSPNEVTVKKLYEICRIPKEVIDETLRSLKTSEGFLSIGDSEVKTNSEQRINLALKAVELGGDIERICRFISWREFEDVTASAFSLNDYRVRRNFRFSWAERRWEIDILAMRKPIIVCVDCKHWKKGLTRSSIAEIVKDHMERTKVFTEALKTLGENLNLKEWVNIVSIPIIVSLHSASLKFYKKVPIVPILQLPSFINDLPVHTDLLRCFKNEIENVNF